MMQLLFFIGCMASIVSGVLARQPLHPAYDLSSLSTNPDSWRFERGEVPPECRPVLDPEAARHLPALRTELTSALKQQTPNFEPAWEVAARINPALAEPAALRFTRDDLAAACLTAAELADACHLPLGQLFICNLEGRSIKDYDLSVHHALIVEPTWQRVRYLDLLDVWTADIVYIEVPFNQIGISHDHLALTAPKTAYEDAVRSIEGNMASAQFGNIFFQRFAELKEGLRYSTPRYARDCGVLRARELELQSGCDNAFSTALCPLQPRDLIENRYRQALTMVRPGSTLMAHMRETDTPAASALLVREFSATLGAVIGQIEVHLAMAYPERAALAALEFLGLHYLARMVANKPSARRDTAYGAHLLIDFGLADVLGETDGSRTRDQDEQLAELATDPERALDLFRKVYSRCLLTEMERAALLLERGGVR